MADSSSLAEAPRPDILATHIASLFQATFTEIGLFIVVFLTVSESTGGRWWFGTNLFVAAYIILLGVAAVLLLKLHSLENRSSDEVVRIYRNAWRSFCWANGTILTYFVVWFVRIVYLVTTDRL